MEHENPRKVIGIDLGTTQSCVSVWQNGQVQIIPNDLGNLKTPSCVAFTNTGRLVGDAAKNQLEKNQENTIYDAKCLIGKNFNDTQLQLNLPLYPFKVINNEGRPQFEVKFKGEIKHFAPEEIISMILAKLKENAESYLGQKVTDAVIAVPASFNTCQRMAVKDAATIAGLNVMRLMNQPTAAGFAYAMNNTPENYSKVLVFDFGSGFCGVTILDVDDSFIFDVKATCGSSSVGGRDIDDILVNHFSEEFERKYEKDLKSNAKAMSKLRIICERVKQSLSSNSVVALEIKSLNDRINFTSKITRATFESLCTTLFQDALDIVKSALRKSKLKKSEIKEIILVGGSSRIPKIQQLLREFFDGRDLNMSLMGKDAAVAQGAALQAAIICKNPSDRIQNAWLLDVTYSGLGVKMEVEVITKFIKRNIAIPANHTRTLVIESRVIEIYEGERFFARDNHLLGTLDLSRIIPAEGKLPRKIELCFSIDVNFDLEVRARDVLSTMAQQIPIEYNKILLTKEEIKEMMSKAEECKEDNRIKLMETE